MINRRNIIKSSILLPSLLFTLNKAKSAKNANVVIIGAGWGGLSAAKTLRNLDRSINITVIELSLIHI